MICLIEANESGLTDLIIYIHGDTSEFSHSTAFLLKIMSLVYAE